MCGCALPPSHPCHSEHSEESPPLRERKGLGMLTVIPTKAGIQRRGTRSGFPRSRGNAVRQRGKQQSFFGRGNPCGYPKTRNVGAFRETPLRLGGCAPFVPGGPFPPCMGKPGPLSRIPRSHRFARSRPLTQAKGAVHPLLPLRGA